MKRTEELYHEANEIPDVLPLPDGPLSLTPKSKSMRWVPIESARKLNFQEIVFIKFDNEVSAGKLVEITNKGNGKIWKFEVALFSNQATDTEPIYTTTVTHVAVP